MAYRGGFTFGYGLTPWVQRLLIANTVVFLATMLDRSLYDYLAFVPGAILFRPWTLLTYMFAHGNFMHLLFNMIGLFFFGPALEARWGSREFIKFYFICGLGGAALSFLLAPAYPIIGASAAVYGVMLGFAMNWPEMPIYIWGILPIQARFLVGLIAIFSFVAVVNDSSDGVAHAAHLGGFVAAFIYLKMDWQRRGLFSGLKKQAERRRMRVVRGDADGDEGRATAAAPGPRERPPANTDDQLLDELDRVLEKISTDGMASLTSAERRLLDDASRRFRKD